MPATRRLLWRLPATLLHPLANAQHRGSFYLILNNLLGAGTGFLFWLLIARVAHVPPAVLGLGYTVVALGTAIGVVAKGGLDTALLQKIPGTSRSEGLDLLSFAFRVGAAVVLALTLLLAFGSWVGDLLPGLTALGWALVAGTALLLLMTWLQDACFLASGHPRATFERNLVLASARLLLPFPVLALAVAYPVPMTWALAMGASALVGWFRLRRLPDRVGDRVPRRAFLRSALRNTTGGAADFLPGLLLAPFVLAMEGQEAAAYFGIAWTAASILFQASTAIGRSALAQMIQAGPAGKAGAIRRGLAEQALFVVPLATAAGLLAPQLLGLFGAEYGRQGAPILAILCGSLLFLAPTSMYMAVLRSRDRSRALVWFPVAMVASLFIWVPLLDARLGLPGVAVGWLLSLVPFGLFAAWRLHIEAAEVMPSAAPTLLRPVNLE